MRGRVVERHMAGGVRGVETRETGVIAVNVSNASIGELRRGR
jgi:hypothetical protein